MKKNLTFLYRNKKNIKIAGEIIHIEASLDKFFFLQIKNFQAKKWGIKATFFGIFKSLPPFSQCSYTAEINCY
jgi:hypothetical protein